MATANKFLTNLIENEAAVCAARDTFVKRLDRCGADTPVSQSLVRAGLHFTGIAKCAGEARRHLDTVVLAHRATGSIMTRRGVNGRPVVTPNFKDTEGRRSPKWKDIATKLAKLVRTSDIDPSAVTAALGDEAKALFDADVNDFDKDFAKRVTEGTEAGAGSTKVELVEAVS